MSAHATRFVLMLFATVLLSAPAAPAIAMGINLSWNDCSLGANAEFHRNFACNTNDGSHVLVASVDPPPGLAELNGMMATIDLTSASCPTPAWWQFVNSGSCRRTALSAAPAPLEGQVACGDLWQGAVPLTYVAAYLEAFEGNYRRTRIVVSAALPVPVDVAPASGTEYYAFNLVIRNTSTVGTGACAGCDVYVCFLISEVKLIQQAGAPGGSPIIGNPLTSNYAAWQGNTLGGPGCPPIHADPHPPCVTPVMNRTWGQIKGIYR